jgi:hypothetical protein
MKAALMLSAAERASHPQALSFRRLSLQGQSLQTAVRHNREELFCVPAHRLLAHGSGAPTLGAGRCQNKQSQA